MAFPFHEIPDGNVFAPHHFYTGIFIALVALWFMVDDYRLREPRVAIIGTMAALYAFVLTWPIYHAVGAALCLVGLGVATAGAVMILRAEINLDGVERRAYPRSTAWSFLAGIAIAWDDALEHALGWWMPLDQFWRVGFGRFVELVDRLLRGALGWVGSGGLL